MLDEDGNEYEIQPEYYDDEGESIYKWNGKEYKSVKVAYYPKGRIVYYGEIYSGVCDEAILLPGTALLPWGFLAVMYGLALIYLFLGISIISDKFMDAIEQITSETVTVIREGEDGTTYEETVDLWNPTVANLSLMALGSSAPEILLAFLETV